MKLNDASMNLILTYEVGGGESYYNKKLQHPTWPGGASGITIGVGYDLGYNSKDTIRSDWLKLLGETTTNRLIKCAGKKEAQARDFLTNVKDILISWASAFSVYQDITIPRFWKLTQSAFPGVDSLHSNCQGALLSLVFNRGSAMDGDRRTEMRAIREIIKKYSPDDKRLYNEIAEQIRSMKRLWRNTSIEKGMSRRREAEANLVLASIV